MLSYDLVNLTPAEFELIVMLVNHCRLGSDTEFSNAAFELCTKFENAGYSTKKEFSITASQEEGIVLEV